MNGIEQVGVEGDMGQSGRHRRLWAVAQASLVVFLWATSYVLIKMELGRIPALTFAGLRYTLAFVCLLPVVLLSGGLSAIRQLPGALWGKILLLGLLFYTFTQGASFLALAYLPAVTASLLWSFSSVAVALMAALWTAERPTGFQWLGVGLATAGAVVYFHPAGIPAGRVVGVVVAGVGVLANGAAALLGREVNRAGEIPPLVVTVISMGIGAALLLAAGIGAQGLPAISLQGWAIIAWLAVVNTAFAFTLWNHTLRTLSAVESTVINGTMQIWIAILAVIFLGERVSLKEVMGLAVVSLGTLIVQLRRPGLVSQLPKREADQHP